MDSESKVDRPCKTDCCGVDQPTDDWLHRLVFGRRRYELVRRWVAYLVLTNFGFAGAMSIPLVASMFHRRMSGGDSASGTALIFFWLLAFIALCAIGFTGAECMACTAKQLNEPDKADSKE